MHVSKVTGCNFNAPYCSVCRAVLLTTQFLQEGRTLELEKQYLILALQTVLDTLKYEVAKFSSWAALSCWCVVGVDSPCESFFGSFCCFLLSCTLDFFFQFDPEGEHELIVRV